MENKVIKIKISGAGLTEVNTEYVASGKRFVIFANEHNVIVMELVDGRVRMAMRCSALTFQERVFLCVTD